MGLDIRIIHQTKITCPECGTVVDTKVVDCVGSGGRDWYGVLESIGYYVPFEQRTEENDWYGKDMILTDEQIDKIMKFLDGQSVIEAVSAKSLIALAKYEGHDVVINADW